MGKPTYYIASFSGGKDSTAMVLRLIETGAPLDEVMFCDVGLEFPAMYEHVERIKQIVESEGIKFATLRADKSFEYYLLEHKPKRKLEKYSDKSGYSWPGPRQRWCTRALKLDVIKKHVNRLRKDYDVRQYVGIALDETARLERPANNTEDRIHPLVEWGWTESDALNYCHARGYYWGGLYDVFHRVSCWCCPLQPFSSLRKLWKQFPDLWGKLRDMDDKTWRPFVRGYTVRELEKRFEFEEVLAESGHSLKNRRFYADMKRHVFEGVPISEILKERSDELEG